MNSGDTTFSSLINKRYGAEKINKWLYQAISNAKRSEAAQMKAERRKARKSKAKQTKEMVFLKKKEDCLKMN